MKNRWILAAGFAAAALSVISARAEISISNKPTQNMSCSAGVCTATAKKATLNTADLTNMLASGDVTVQSGSGNDTAAGIQIIDGFSWTSTSRLTLTARHNITVEAPVTVAGQGALTLNYGTANPDSDSLFENNGKIDFQALSSDLKINGGSYTLVRDLKTLAAKIMQNKSGLYALANDYDASVDGTYAQSPVSDGMTGIVEGMGNSILNLHIISHNEQDSTGLFSSVSGTVRDLGLQFAQVKSAAYVTGALVGVDLGAVIGCHSSGLVITHRNASGGLIGFLFPAALVKRSSSSATVFGGYAVGGLIAAAAAGGVVVESYASGQVYLDGRTHFAGGLIGDDHGDIAGAYATGAVQSAPAGPKSSHDSLHPTFVGGFVGKARGSAVQTYSVGAVASIGGNGGYTGLDGAHDGKFSSNYWDLDTSQQAQGCGYGDCAGIMGVTDSQLKAGLPEGFDPNIWGQSPNINNGYPYLLANPPRE